MMKLLNNIKKRLVNWGIKKYVVGIVNDVLDAKQENVSKARAVVSRYVIKIDALLSFLKSLDEKLADNKVTNEEADDIVDDAELLAKALVRAE